MRSGTDSTAEYAPQSSSSPLNLPSNAIPATCKSLNPDRSLRLKHLVDLFHQWLYNLCLLWQITASVHCRISFRYSAVQEQVDTMITCTVHHVEKPKALQEQSNHSTRMLHCCTASLPHSSSLQPHYLLENSFRTSPRTLNVSLTKMSAEN
jgi:hypothetical protein